MLALSQLRAFYERKKGELKPNEIAVYMELFMLNNDRRWEEWFPVTMSYLSALTGINSSNTVSRIINSLEQKGYIKVRRGKKKQPNSYSLVKLYTSNFEGQTEYKQNTNGTQMEYKRNINGTQMGDIIRVDIEKSSNTTSDLLTFGTPEMTPAEEQVKSAFERDFHPLTKLEDLEKLKALTGDYGAKSMLRAMESVAGKMDIGRRQRLSPSYFLPMLRDGMGNKLFSEPVAYNCPSKEEQETRRKKQQEYDEWLVAIAEGRIKDGESG